MEKEDGAKASHPVRKGGGPPGVTEAKRQAGQSQAQKGGEQDPVKQSLAWRKPVVVSDLFLLIHHFTFAALFGRSLLATSPTLTARFMNLLMLGVFTFFGLHTILWFVRSLGERRKNGGKGEEAASK